MHLVDVSVIPGRNAREKSVVFCQMPADTVCRRIRAVIPSSSASASSKPGPTASEAMLGCPGGSGEAAEGSKAVDKSGNPA